jgi:hypothetical protein
VAADAGAPLTDARVGLVGLSGPGRRGLDHSCQLDARVDVQLVEDVSHVRVDSVMGEEQAYGDLAIGEAVHDELGDGELRLGEALPAEGPSISWRGRRARRANTDQRPDQDVAVANGLDGTSTDSRRRETKLAGAGSAASAACAAVFRERADRIRTGHVMRVVGQRY